jgi:hypothetical protein
MGGRDECGEEGRAPRPFIGSEGERGGRTGKGIGRPVVVASMPVVRFGGEGKLSLSAVPFLGEEGTPGRCTCTLEAASAAAPSVARGRRSWAGPTRQ